MTTPAAAHALPTRLAGADVLVVLDGPLQELVEALDRVTAGSAFHVVSAEAEPGGRARVRFATDVVVGWGTVLDLQHRLHRAVEVVAVERRSAAELLASA